jgi:peptidoglycan/LPS O-acetylase OafA/YrhL
MFTGIYPAWSLTPEVTFYVLFPLISWLITRFGWWWQQVVFFWAVGALLYLFFHFFPFRGFFPDFAFVIMATFFGRCLEFFAGMLLADCFIRHQAKTGRPERDGSVPLYTLGGGVIILAVIIIGAMLSPNAAMANRPVGLVLSTFVFPVGIASFLYGLVTETTWTGRLLSTQLFQVFGKGAYAFFLVHSGFIAGWLFDVWNGNQFLFFISLLFVSILLYYFIERPLNKWIKTKGIRQEVPMPAP